MVDTVLKWPAPVRHLLAGLAGVLLTWGGTEWVPILQDQSNITGGTLAAGLTYLVGALTPLVTSYGVGSARARQLGARTPADV